MNRHREPYEWRISSIGCLLLAFLGVTPAVLPINPTNNYFLEYDMVSITSFVGLVTKTT
jgi:hypothetical protein